MTMRLSRLAALVVTAALVATACGDDGGTAAAPTTTAAATTPTTTGAGAAPSTTLSTAEIAKCADANAKVPNPGDTLTFSWGGGLTKEGVEKYVKPVFEKTSGLKMTVLGASSADTIAKIIAQGGGGDLDVIYTSQNTLELGRAANVLLPLNYNLLPETKNLAKSKLDPNPAGNVAVTVTEFAYGVAYRIDTLKKKNLPEPTSTRDMLNPIYGDAVGLYAPPFAGAVAQIGAFNELAGGAPNDPTKGIASLAALKSARSIANSAVMDAAVADGSVAMWYSASATVQGLLDNGVQVNMVFDPAYTTGIYVTIPKGSKNAGAACIFANWSVSKEGQEALQKVNGNAPVRTDVPLRPDTVLSSKLPKTTQKSYQDLITPLPSSEKLTELWNTARK